MILRLIIENFLSFKEATEINFVPSSKSKNLEHHKFACEHATVLRLSAIYGANGAGKSNLIKAITLIQQIVKEGLKLQSFYSDVNFAFDDNCNSKPSEFAVEFCNEDTIFYYHLALKGKRILTEELYKSELRSDIPIIKRQSNGDSMDVYINPKYATISVTDVYLEALNNIIRPDMSLFGYLASYYSDRFPMVKIAYDWFSKKLSIVNPQASVGIMPHLFHADSKFATLVNSVVSALGTGVSRIEVVVEKMNPDMQSIYKQECDVAVKQPGLPVSAYDRTLAQTFNIVFENDNLYRKYLVPIHVLADGNSVRTPYGRESDGTRRVIEFMPMLYAISHENYVFFVDEIERSLHPIMIKELIRKISKSADLGGQLIFTTHESCLLDQDIFRPDEIWFAQKDIDQSTQLYPMSDFNIHRTANIENGYIQGRYGAIPFLSNLDDLHWN